MTTAANFINTIADAATKTAEYERLLKGLVDNGFPELAAALVARPGAIQAASEAIKAVAAAQEMVDDFAVSDGLPVLGKAFFALMRVEGLETGDGRMWELGSSEWAPLPFPFMVQDTTPHGPDQIPEPAWAAGQVEIALRDPSDPSRILAAGHLMPGPIGEAAETLMRYAFRGVSCDSFATSPAPPDIQPTVVDQNGDVLDVLVRYSGDIIRRLTMVPTPAFESTCAWMADEPMPQVAADAHGAVIPTDTQPDVMVIPDQMVASAGGPVNPPRDWFFVPEPDRYQPIEVSADGHWTGHIAAAGQCHIGYVGKCETAPMSTTSPPFKAFHRTVARCDDNTEVACGWLTIDTKHQWDFGADAKATADYYDHTGTCVAKIRASNGKYGIWTSGAIVPGIDDRTVWLLQGPEVSGDWRRYVDPETRSSHNRELLSVLAVPVPGFPGTRTRPELLVASGEIVAQRGTFLPCDCEEGEPMNAQERAEFDELKLKVDALVASGAPTTVSAAALTETLRTAVTAKISAGMDPAAARAEVGDEFQTGIAAGFASGEDTIVAAAEDVAAAAREHAADALLAAAYDIDLATLTQPLTAAEFTRYGAKYSDETRLAMVAAGAAMRDGSFPVGDLDDLTCAIRSTPATSVASRAHVARRAAALGYSALIPKDWSESAA